MPQLMTNRPPEKTAKPGPGFLFDLGLLGDQVAPQEATPAVEENPKPIQLAPRGFVHDLGLVEQTPRTITGEVANLAKRAKELLVDRPGQTFTRGIEQIRRGVTGESNLSLTDLATGKKPQGRAEQLARGAGNVALSIAEPLAGVQKLVFGDPVANVTKELGGGETAQEVASFGAEVAGGLGTSAALAKVPGMMSRVASEVLGYGKPAEREIVDGAVRSVPGIAARYRDTVDKLGHAFVERAVPKVFRAGRGTPVEFREARALMEADIANSIEQAVTLGGNLKADLTVGERLRADQLLRGGITTAKTPQKIVDAVTPVRQEIDRIQKELVSLGRLSPETVDRFQENFGPYIARLYASKEFTPRDAVIPFAQPVRAGTDRLKMRGERIDVEIPSLEKEMNAVSKLLGPESEFRKEFRQTAKELTKRKETTVSEKVSEATLGRQRTSKTETRTTGGEGEFTQVPLSGVAARLEKIVTDALETRGMTAGEAQAAIGRVKAAAVTAAREGPEVKITGGGTTTEKITETVKETIQRNRETVKTVIENLNVNNAQRAALHAYYDAISRAGAKAKSIQAGGKTYRIEPVMDAESGLERAAALKPLLDAGYKVESRTGNKVSLFRDIPEEIRTAPAGQPVMRGGKEIGVGMGELRTEPGYVAGKSIAQTGREAAVVKFFKTVSDNPEWSSKVERSGFTQMPDDGKRLADLAGKYVRSDIAAEINDAMRIKTDLEKITNRITSLWKIGKVTNPATISRNFMSSAIMADWGGLSPYRPSGIQSYSRAALGFAGKDERAVKLLAEAKKAGLFRSGYNQAEISALADGFVVSKEPNAVLRILDGVKAAVDNSKVGQVYGAVDSFYKGALYVHGREQLHMAPQAAARYAKKFGIDYQDISPFVRTVRELPLGSPFLTFASKAIPLAIETSVKHPVRFWKWPAALLGLNELSKANFDGERGEVEKLQEVGSLKSPRYVVLPGKTEDGRNRFLDLGYILPFGDLLEAFDKLQGGSGASISFEPLGGPFQSIAEVAFNKSLFTNRPIYLETDSFKERYTKIADHTLKSLLPALAPPLPGTGFRGGYSTEAFRKALAPDLQLPLEAPIPRSDFLGRQRGIMATFASKLLGVDVKEVKMEDLQRIGLIEFQQQIDQLDKQMTRISLMDIDDPKKEVEAAKIAEKYQAVAEAWQKKYQDALVPQKKKIEFTHDLGLMRAPVSRETVPAQP